MTNDLNSFEARFALLSEPSLASKLKNIRHGIEREALRVNENGGIAQTNHPSALGSSLTHDFITTDFSESLLEFITPPDSSVKTSIAQLIDIHKFTYQSIDNEYLWPLSMPCFIDSETNIPIAQYGTSNIAKMKEVYRTGLHHRYGSMMQVIAGVHFNFSLPETFWQLWCERHGQVWDKDTQSEHYFSLIRNFKRLAWVIPYLFGASPALCSSFISHRDTPHAFQKVGKGTLYLPYATSLRMSDLGYTSSAQSSLSICHNDLRTYVNSVRSAMGQKASEYAKFSCSEKDGWEQLNDNVLQIENELYSPIRPKQIAESLEMPTNALENRGVRYIEVRSLDVNPYSPIGIDEDQFYFLDVFLLTNLLMPTDFMSEQESKTAQENVNLTVLKGRDPNLLLDNSGISMSIPDWSSELISKWTEVASLLDHIHSNTKYTDAVRLQEQKFLNPEITPSGKWLSTLLENNIDNSILGLELAKEYKAFNRNLSFKNINQQRFEEQASVSLQAQKEIENSETESFESFVKNYFDKRKASDKSITC